MLKEILKQFPFIYPRSFIYTKNYIKEASKKETYYKHNRTHTYIALAESSYIKLATPMAMGKEYNKYFIKNFSYQTSEKFIFTLNCCYIYGSKGITLTRENQLLIDLTHNFDIASTEKTVLKKPFKTFALNIETLDGVNASLLAPVVNNYYHFIFDVLLRLKYYETYKGIIDYYLIDEDLDPKFLNALFEYTSIKPTQIKKISFDKKYKVINLIVSSLTGSEGRLCMEDIDYLKHKLKIKELPNPQHNIYIKRGDVLRNIVNEKALIALLEKYNYKIYDFANTPISEQLQIVADAKNIIAFHGAALTNIIAMSTGNVLEIFSEEYFRTDCFYPLAVMNNLKYCYVVGQKAPGWGNVSVDLQIIENTFLKPNAKANAHLSENNSLKHESH